VGGAGTRFVADEDAASKMTRDRGTRGRWWVVPVCLLAVVGGVGFAVWPRGPELIRYVSPPMSIQGRTYHIEILVPGGWAPTGPHYIEGVYYIQFLERKQGFMGFLWPVRRLFGREETDAWLEIAVGDTADERDEKIHLLIDAQPAKDGSWTCRADRTILTEPICDISYLRTKRNEFNATYRQICDSFKVVEVAERSGNAMR